MATQNHQLSSAEVTNLTQELNLLSGKTYLLQAVGGFVYLHEAATEPSTDISAAHHIAPRETWGIKQGTENIYAWGPSWAVVTGTD